MTSEWTHALDRIEERCVGLDTASIKNVVALAERAFRFNATAVRITTLDNHRGPTDADFYKRAESNGDEVWAIIRYGRCTTVMLRRANQERTPKAFNCDAIRYARLASVGCPTSAQRGETK